MAKVVYERAKPHVNSATSTERLTRIGVSRPGALQLLSGQPVTDRRDRQLIAELVAAALEPHARQLVSGHKFTLERLPDDPPS
jgi:hypothetical protein